MTYHFGCVVMAAGRSERFGENKLLRELDGKPLALRTLEAIPRDAFAKIITVTRFAEICQFSETLGFAVVENDAPEEGLSRTIRLGLAETADCDAVLFTVADQPMLSRETFLRLLAAWKPGRICAAAEAYYQWDGRRRHSLPLAGTPYEKTADEAAVVKVYSELCVGCGLCARRCPAGAIAVRQGKAQVSGGKCLGCGMCVKVCPKAAICDLRGRSTRG